MSTTVKVPSVVGIHELSDEPIQSNVTYQPVCGGLDENVDLIESC